MEQNGGLRISATQCATMIEFVTSIRANNLLSLVAHSGLTAPHLPKGTAVKKNKQESSPKYTKPPVLDRLKSPFRKEEVWPTFAQNNLVTKQLLSCVDLAEPLRKYGTQWGWLDV